MTEPSPALIELRSQALRMLRPPPRFDLSTWMEAEMRLPSDLSNESGPIRLKSVQRGIADAISDPSIQRVTLVKPVRVGLTTLLTGAIGSFVANDPGPIMVLLPTESDCRTYITSVIEPVARVTPALAMLTDQKSAESGRNTITQKGFPGGSLKVVAAKSPRNLRALNVRYLLIDEIDAMGVTAEGSPIELAINRTRSFPNAKIVLGSTPTLEETSNVLRSYASSDQRVFEVPCPACGAFTEILWGHIEFDPDDPSGAAFRCPHCEALIDEKHKRDMVAAGEWRVTRPDVAEHAGFRMNALISTLPSMAWGALAKEFVEVRDQPERLQTFVNTILAQGWRVTGEESDPSDLAARVEPFSLESIPAEVSFLTAGVDVQGDRLEVSIVGHGRDAVFVLDHSILYGSPDDFETWSGLDALIQTTWKHARGGTIRLDAVAVDSGDGDTTKQVYDYCRARRRVFAIKGDGGARPPWQHSKRHGAALFIVGVDGLKSTIARRLAKVGSIRFSDTLGVEYFNQLASERRRVTWSRGQPVARFERIPGRRAETLDCLVYALAARHGMNVNFDRREEELATQAAPPVRKTVVKSAWLEA